MKYIRLEPNLIYYIHDTQGLKLLTRLRVGLNHLFDHKFKDKFQECAYSICACGQNIETTIPFLSYCPNHPCKMKILLQEIHQISWNISEQSDSTITNILLLVNNKLDFETKKTLLMSTTEFIWSIKEFSFPPIEENIMNRQHY